MIGILLKKDLLLEVKSREILISMIAFGIAVTLLYAFSFRPSPELVLVFAPGLMWTLFLFISTLAIHRSHSLEKEFDAFSLMLSAPINRSTLFISKCLCSLIFLIISQAILMPVFALFLQIPSFGNISQLIGVFFLVDLGISFSGSLISGAVMRARGNEFLLPLLLYPIVTPLMISAVKSTAAIMSSAEMIEWKLWFQIILTYDIVFGLLGLLSYDYVTEE
ncbi:MAG: hypothetical protein CMG75_10585 [Candidatus Marinimicrobia bacterium]|nr:hypothetical protein [Candidatus Neomarinimicrobiota bacterium]|tara:strand:- start:1249 stop:1911 length:663 start_codon:yes stop_codon:yes gene_type:complete